MAALYAVNSILSIIAKPALSVVMGTLELLNPLEYLQSYHGRDVTAEEVSEETLKLFSLI